MLIRTGLITLALSTSACASFLGFLAGANLHDAEPQKAQNPLSGAPATYRTTSRDSVLADVGHHDCTTWPMHDQYVLHAEGDQLCLESVVKYSVAPAYGGQRMPPKWTLVGDGNKTTQLQLQDTQEPTQIGTCQHGSTTYEVWQQAVAGCAPNAGTLTEKSTQLAIRVDTPAVKYNVAAWTFQ
jgi:hypothetical protein